MSSEVGLILKLGFPAFPMRFSTRVAVAPSLLRRCHFVHYWDLTSDAPHCALDGLRNGLLDLGQLAFVLLIDPEDSDAAKLVVVTADADPKEAVVRGVAESQHVTCACDGTEAIE